MTASWGKQRGNEECRWKRQGNLQCFLANLCKAKTRILCDHPFFFVFFCRLNVLGVTEIREEIKEALYVSLSRVKVEKLGLAGMEAYHTTTLKGHKSTRVGVCKSAIQSLILIYSYLI